MHGDYLVRKIIYTLRFLKGTATEYPLSISPSNIFCIDRKSVV